MQPKTWARLGKEFILGLNYWPRKTGPRMWFRWDPASINEDLRIIKSLGVRAVRFFLLLQDMANPHAEPHPEVLERLAEFLNLLGEHGLAGFATILVGHMSGRNWGISFEPSDGVYSVTFLRRLRRFLEALVMGVGGEALEPVKAWVLSNELMLYAKPRDREEYLGFVESAVRMIKSLDPGKLVGLGDVTGPGAEAPNVARICDYCGYHLYYYDADPVRHGLAYALAVDVNSLGGEAPVIAEELGFSSAQYSNAEIGKFLRSVLVSILGNGASGAFVWCFSDFNLEGEPPYLWKPFELRFGVVDSEGKLKPQARVLKEFSRLLEELESRGIYPDFTPLKDPVALLYPAFTYAEGLEFIDCDPKLIKSSLLETYAALKTMGVNPIVLPEDSLTRFSRRLRLVMIPSIPTLLSTTWRHLTRFVNDGGSLYYSYLRHANHPHDSPTHLCEELFGVTPNLPAGSPGTHPPDEVVVRVGDGRELIKVPRGDPALLGNLFKPIKAQVVGEGKGGDPQLFLARLGDGNTLLMSFPIEALAYDNLRLDEGRAELRKLYAFALRVAGLEPVTRVKPEHEGLEIIQWLGGGSEAVLFVINHSLELAHATVSVRGKDVVRVEVLGAFGTSARLDDGGIEAVMEGRSALVALIEVV